MALFEMGDEVEFELGENPNGGVDCYPRWDGSRDRGGSRVWWPGRVSRVSDVTIEVGFFNRETGLYETWTWPIDGFLNGRSGWLRHTDSRSSRSQCECGALKVWGRGPHSDWCPLWLPR